MTHDARNSAPPAGPIDGAALIGATGEALGTLAGVALYRPKGAIAYAILASGGVAGLGRRYRAIPWDLLSYDDQHGRYVTLLVREDLVVAPEIARRAVSGWNDAEARAALYRHYGPLGAKPFWT